jgi:hypothetical protein
VSPVLWVCWICESGQHGEGDKFFLIRFITYRRVYNGPLGQAKLQRLPDAIVELEKFIGKFAANNISGTVGSLPWWGEGARV